MTFFSRLRFSRKVFLAIFGTSVGTGLVVGLALDGALSASRRAEFAESYADHVRLLGKAISLNEDFADATRLLRELVRHDPDNLSVELVGEHGETLERIRRPEYDGGSVAGKYASSVDGVVWEDGRLIVIGTTDREGAQKGNRLVMTVSTRSLDAGLRQLQFMLAAVFAALLVFSWLLARVLTAGLSRRVHAIHGVLSGIAASGDYSKRVGPGSTAGDDEVAELGRNLNGMLETLQSHQARLLEAERDKARGQIAAQVAHDIRSPLMSLNMALAQIGGAPAAPLEILRSATARIAGIVQKLAVSANPAGSGVGSDAKPGARVEEPKLTLVEPLVVAVANEHAVRKAAHQALNVTGVGGADAIWSVIQVSEIQSAVSNIVNNAFEAGATEVTLALTAGPKTWTLAIRDDGGGIPAAALGKIFDRGFTSGKKTGTGLGLHQAKSAVEWSGGTIAVESREGEGTAFTLTLPREKKPSWLPERLEVAADQPICFVDDDQTVLDQWRSKAAAAGLKNAMFFRSVEAFRELLLPEDAIVVIDQNIGDGPRGLDVLAELELGRASFLCTSDFDEKGIQDQVGKLGVGMIPKPWIANIELKVRA